MMTRHDFADVVRLCEVSRRGVLSGLDLPPLQCTGYNASFVFLRNYC
jgi:hypothetical protein